MRAKPINYIVYIIAAFVVLVSIGCLVAASVVVTTSENDTSADNENVDDGLSATQMVDFLSYQRIYGKVYESYSELLRRSQLFYARAMRVFVVCVKYLRGKSTKFLRVGFFSDRTDRERASLFENFVENDSMPETEMRNRTIATTRRRKRSTIEETSPLNEMEDSFCPSGRRLINSAKSILRTLSGRKSNENNRMYLDYRKSRCISPVRTQRYCGACYIFSVVTLYEYHQCIATGKRVDFSEQYILDCAPSRMKKMRGCFGGQEWGTVEFVERYGLERAKRLPYKEWTSECPYANGTDPSVMGSARVHHATSLFTMTPKEDDKSAHAMVQEYHAPDSKFVTRFRLNPYRTFDALAMTQDLERYGPLAISIRQNHDMFEYGGGVDMMEDCYMKGGHSMAVIGHGIENGEEFFLIRNTHGPKWGVKGYYKLSKRLNPKCFVRYGYIEAKFSKNETYKRRT